MKVPPLLLSVIYNHDINVRMRATYIFVPCVYEVLEHAELFGLFHLFTLFLKVFDYTTRFTYHWLELSGNNIGQYFTM